MGSTLVLGYDGSDCAKAALQAAVEAAQAFGDGIVVAFGAGVYPIGEDSDHKRLLRKRGTDLAEEALSAIRSAGVTECDAAVVDARPGRRAAEGRRRSRRPHDRARNARRASACRGGAWVGAAQAVAPLDATCAGRPRPRLTPPAHCFVAASLSPLDRVRGRPGGCERVPFPSESRVRGNRCPSVSNVRPLPPLPTSHRPFAGHGVPSRRRSAFAGIRGFGSHSRGRTALRPSCVQIFRVRRRCRAQRLSSRRIRMAWFDHFAQSTAVATRVCSVVFHGKEGSTVRVR